MVRRRPTKTNQSPLLVGRLIVFLKGAKKSRGDPTRTGDHLVPNQVRYQLRYTPIAFSLTIDRSWFSTKSRF